MVKSVGNKGNKTLLDMANELDFLTCVVNVGLFRQSEAFKLASIFYSNGVMKL